MKLGLFTDIQDHMFMQEALAQARKAAELNEVPIGAVVVNQEGIIIGRSHNITELTKTQLGHAEIQAIKQANETLQNWRLSGCWLYVTLEPCTMCMGLISLSRLAGITYGADSPIFGSHLDKVHSLYVYKIGTPAIKRGVCGVESAKLLKDFFKQKREKG